MIVMTKPKTTCSFIPAFQVGDPIANYWLQQVTRRLRRELCWLWHEQGILPEAQKNNIPPLKDKVAAALEEQRFWENKQAFFKTDVTAKYLTDKINGSPPDVNQSKAKQGSFSWVVKMLCLSDVETFILALSLITTFDNSAGSVIAACLNDMNRNQPNLSLAQKLWNRPEQILILADPTHPFYSNGLLQSSYQILPETRIDWEKPLAVSAIVARQLLYSEPVLPRGLRLLDNPEIKSTTKSEAIRLLVARLDSLFHHGMNFVPLLGPKGSPAEELMQDIMHLRQRPVTAYQGDPQLLKNTAYLNSLATFCWLKGYDLFLDSDQTALMMGERNSLDLDVMPMASIPITLFLGITERKQIKKLPTNYVLPVIEVPQFSFAERLQYWKQNLGSRMPDNQQVLGECSRRFRFQKKTIKTICQSLQDYPGKITEKILIQVCRSELELDIGDLAQKVIPRFQDEQLILPPKQARQFEEISKAMQALTKVHYEWGTERVWNESGISVLFAGAPGTGKTMAAEILAIQLDLPIFRVDLSQVVSKYIGETEKNLKRLFDAADISDTILFFDEADSLFGRRSEVKDAHDRYANLEISYLLERMERFKGLAILATNRKKDLDEAFLRRLRYIVDFPLPGEKERKKIWQQVIPPAVDAAKLDFDFLAKQFNLTGGHIRSIIFNACLQSAPAMSTRPEKNKGKLDMEQVVVAIRREYEKLNRTTSLEQFGSYAGLIEKMGR